MHSDLSLNPGVTTYMFAVHRGKTHGKHTYMFAVRLVLAHDKGNKKNLTLTVGEVGKGRRQKKSLSCTNGKTRSKLKRYSLYLKIK
jgi:hypothetical protein